MGRDENELKERDYLGCTITIGGVTYKAGNFTFGFVSLSRWKHKQNRVKKRREFYSKQQVVNVLFGDRTWK